MLIDVRSLVKEFPGVRAVDDVTFGVAEGEIFGFLGPNGAGKTTTIRIIVTLMSATSGTVLVNGINVADRPEDVRKCIGYAAQFIGIDNDLTARENLVMQARLHGVDRQAAQVRAVELIEVLQLEEAADRRAGTFSGGMRRRLDLAQALTHDPRVLFLDEPTTGLDPQTRRALWGYLRDLNRRGVTIFLTTQYMEEADALAGRLAIIDHGTIVVTGTPGELKAALGGEAITVTLADDVAATEVDRASKVLSRFSEHETAQTYERAVRVFTADGSAKLAEIVRVLDTERIVVTRLELSEPTLDDVFLRHTGGRMRVDEVKAPSNMIMGGRGR